MTERKGNETEHSYTHISTTLGLEKLDVNLYRSKSLTILPRGKGVFGGQVVSQATVAVTDCVDPAYGMHVSEEPLFDVSHLTLGPSVYPCECYRHA